MRRSVRADRCRCCSHVSSEPQSLQSTYRCCDNCAVRASPLDTGTLVHFVRRVPVRPEFCALFRLGSRNSSDHIYRNSCSARHSPAGGYSDWSSRCCAHICRPGVAAFQSDETPQLGPNRTLASLSPRLRAIFALSLPGSCQSPGRYSASLCKRNSRDSRPRTAIHADSQSMV